MREGSSANNHKRGSESGGSSTVAPMLRPQATLSQGYSQPAVAYVVGGLYYLLCDQAAAAGLNPLLVFQIDERRQTPQFP